MAVTWQQALSIACGERGFKVLALECAKPAAIRRQVALCEAVYQGSAQVEGLTARLINSLAEADAVWEHDEVPVLVDEAAG